MIFRYILSIALFISFASGADAQEKDSAATSGSAHFIAGATYNTGLNYYGRVDSLHSRAFYPFVGLSLKNGLYINSSFVFIQNSLQDQYAATILEAGYNFKDSKGKWAGNIAVSKFFYQQDIDLIQSAVKESASASVTYLGKILDVTAGINAKYSDKVDLGVQGALDHIFRFPHIFGKKDVIVVDPTATLYAGTQNFTQTYYEKQNFLIFPVASQQVTTNSRQFNVLAYELAVPIVYGYKKFNFILSPAYILPQNLLVVPGQPALSENGANLFYLTASVKLTL